jgi:hypothetical protein
MGSLSIIKKNEKYYLITGHHKFQALKEVYGEDFDEMINSKGKRILQKAIPLQNVIWYSKNFKTKFIRGENSSTE